jgi:hypothetical protein
MEYRFQRTGIPSREHKFLALPRKIHEPVLAEMSNDLDIPPSGRISRSDGISEGGMLSQPSDPRIGGKGNIKGKITALGWRSIPR